MEDEEVAVFGELVGEEALAFPDDEGTGDAENEAAGVFAGGMPGIAAQIALNNSSHGGSSWKRRRHSMGEDDEHNPVDWHMRMQFDGVEQAAKRAKMAADEAVLERLTERIVEARRRKRQALKLQQNFLNVDEEEEVEDETELIMRLPPMDGSAWVGVNSEAADERLYIRLSKRHQESSRNSAVRRIATARVLLLTESPVEKLVAEAQILRERRILAESLAAEEERERRAREEADGQSLTLSGDEGRPQHSELWVNKYAPRAFVDLLSDTAVNRQLMTWFRLWDESVFGRPFRLTAEEKSDEREAAALALNDGTPKMPVHKIVLLSGVAGTGKTCLVGVAARTAGYSLIETNASDARTVPDMERLLAGAATARRGVDANDKRPLCLLLDEVDGAGADAVKVIVAAATATGKKALRRPIICTCNNAFAPALRELRGIAFHIQLSAPESSKIEERLRQISVLESLQVDSGVLTQLVRLTEGDMRLSLNSLQWLASSALCGRGHPLSMADLNEAAAGLEAQIGHSSPFHQWSTILELAKHHDSRSSLRPLNERLRAIERIVHEEDKERLLTGVHHNWLFVPSLTPSALHAAARWLALLDLLQTCVHASKHFVIYRYLPACFSGLHIAVATHARAQLSMPTVATQQQQRLWQSQETVAELRSRLRPLSAPTELVLDTLPLALHALQPQIKNVNTQLHSNREKALIQEVVAGLKHFGLTFTPITLDNTVHYIFSPPIDVLTMFDIVDRSARHPLPSAARRMLAHEVALASMKGGGRGGANQEENTKKKQQKEPITGSSRMGGVPPSVRRDLTSHSEDSSSTPILYRFNNCYSNAVKRSIRMSQLLS